MTKQYTASGAAAIASLLRSLHRSTTREPLPDGLAGLLRRLEEAER